ncbi:hypothetical protein K440DRAFT_635953 [Wilcoxina mikolae CBS 423.85]|nr:hypothetical protein K440DRAFT_635953 [Wilcoxina mikolae CBS 423.85]
MDIFTDVSDTAYETLKIFHYSRSANSPKAVAVTAQTGHYVTAVYVIISTLIIMMVREYIAMCVLVFYPFTTKDTATNTSRPGSNKNSQTDGSIELGSIGHSNNRKPHPTTADNVQRYRGIAVVGFWNHQEPVHALVFMFEYFTAVIRARAGSVFIPQPPQPPNSQNKLRLQALNAPAVLRTIGSPEAAEVTIGGSTEVYLKFGINRFERYEAFICIGVFLKRYWASYGLAEVSSSTANRTSERPYEESSSDEAMSPSRAVAVIHGTYSTLNETTIPSNKTYGIIVSSVGR